MSIAILDSTLSQIAVIDDYQSLLYTRAWHDVGSFEFIINSNLLQSEYVTKGNFILVDNNYKKIGIITETEKHVGRNGKIDETIRAKGYEAKYILSRRIVIPPSGSDRYQYTDDVETIMKNVVSSQIVSATDTDRNDALITVSASAGIGPTIQISSRYKNLLEELQGLSLSTGCGYFMEFVPATKKLNFDISLGVDRTSGQTSNARVIFSSAYDTIKEATLTESEISYKNLAYIGGQGEGKDRNVRTVFNGTEPTGLNRREYFIDARDLSSNTDLDARAADSLEANSFSMFIDASALEYGQFKYETDYNLGDIVTIQELGTSQDVRITSVSESWSSGGYDISMTFDRSFPELNKQVSNNFSAVNETLRATEKAKYTEGGVLFADASGNVDEDQPSFEYDATNKVVIIDKDSGLNRPSIATDSAFHMIGKDGAGFRTLQDTFASFPTISGRRANGTRLAPSAIALNDVLLRINALGYGATSYLAQAVSVEMVATEAWSDTVRGSKLRVSTTRAGGTTIAQDIEFREGYIGVTRGANVASATTITPTGEIFHVTGTTAVVTINAPYAGFNGAITIIPDGIFTWTAAGNIALAGTAVVSKALTMTYDSTTVKWYPSYT
jgi:hypothetical protein